MSIDLSQPTLFAEALRTTYLERRSGVLEVELTGKRKKLFFRDGELYLHPLDEMTHLLVDQLRGSDKAVRPAAVPEFCQAVDKKVYELCEHSNVMARLLEHQELPPNLLGPLPTVRMSMAAAVHGCGETALLRRLGGLDALYQSSSRSPAMAQLPGLDPEMAQVLISLEKPVRVGELIRGVSNDAVRQQTLRGLARLRAAGLVEPVTADRSRLVSNKLLKRFLARFADDLELDPLEIEEDDHREQITGLLGEIGELDHYRLLDIGLGASESEVLEAYNALARVVHPSHAARVGFAGRAEALELLFERATEAYLVLSDPARRSSYNNLIGSHVKVKIDDEVREQEKRDLARENYQRGLRLLTQRDFSRAVDLLKEAVRLDRRPEYLARLGLAQARNPNWRRHALASCREAVDLAPGDLGIRLIYGKVLESLGESDDARGQYQKILGRDGTHAGATEALRRLAQREQAAASTAAMVDELVDDLAEMDVEWVGGDEDAPQVWDV